MCPAGYEKCGGATFGSDSYHCFLPSTFAVSGGVAKSYSCRQNTLMLGAGASNSDSTPVDSCESSEALSLTLLKITKCGLRVLRSFIP